MRTGHTVVCSARGSPRRGDRPSHCRPQWESRASSHNPVASGLVIKLGSNSNLNFVARIPGSRQAVPLALDDTLRVLHAANARVPDDRPPR